MGTVPGMETTPTGDPTGLEVWTMMDTVYVRYPGAQRWAEIVVGPSGIEGQKTMADIPAQAVKMRPETAEEG